VKSFYTAGHLFDVLTLFGELDAKLQETRKYAKWKAAHIHACLKGGRLPQPGPVDQPAAEADAGAEAEQPPLAGPSAAAEPGPQPAQASTSDAGGSRRRCRALTHTHARCRDRAPGRVPEGAEAGAPGGQRARLRRREHGRRAAAPGARPPRPLSSLIHVYA